jgi:hypothetical protein
MMDWRDGKFGHPRSLRFDGEKEDKRWATVNDGLGLRLQGRRCILVSDGQQAVDGGVSGSLRHCPWGWVPMGQAEQAQRRPRPGAVKLYGICGLVFFVTDVTFLSSLSSSPTLSFLRKLCAPSPEQSVKMSSVQEHCSSEPGTQDCACSHSGKENGHNGARSGRQTKGHLGRYDGVWICPAEKATRSCEVPFLEGGAMNGGEVRRQNRRRSRRRSSETGRGLRQ